MESAKPIGQNGHTRKRKKLKTDWICVNPSCTKSKSDVVITAKPFVIAYYGGKVDEKRKRKVCEKCLVQAQISLGEITEKLKSKEPFHEVALPLITESAVVLDDSDEEDKGAKTDSSTDSELEFSMDETQTVEDLLKETFAQLEIPKQIENATEDLTKRLDSLNAESSEIDATFLSLEKEIDKMRAQLYDPFRPKLEHKGQIEIIDVPSDITPVSQMTGVDPNLPPLPPIGLLQRPPLNAGTKVIAMKGKDILSVWDDATVSEIMAVVAGMNDLCPYKVKFDHLVAGKIKSSFYKRLGLKHIAYYSASKVRLQVGTRIIGKISLLWSFIKYIFELFHTMQCVGGKG